MDKLRETTRRLTFLVWGLAASIYFALYYTIAGFKTWMETSAIYGISWTVIPISLVLFYEKFGWKLAFRELDFDGYWDFSEKHFTPTSEGERFDYDASGYMHVVQSSRSIRIVSGHTYRYNAQSKKDEEISSWWSVV